MESSSKRVLMENSNMYTKLIYTGKLLSVAYIYNYLSVEMIHGIQGYLFAKDI